MVYDGVVFVGDFVVNYVKGVFINWLIDCIVDIKMKCFLWGGLWIVSGDFSGIVGGDG